LLFLAVLMTAGFAFLGNASSHSGVLKVAAQASPTEATPVQNALTVTTDSITLGSVIEATGNVRTVDGPLAGATVDLHLGDIVLAHTQTDENGDYTFSAPVGLYYVPAALTEGATIYTVVEPVNASFVSTASGVADVPVDVFPLYLAIVVLTGVIIAVLYSYIRRMQGKPLLPSRGKPAKPGARKPAKPGAESYATRLRRIYDEASFLPLRRKPAKPGAALYTSEAAAPHSAGTAELKQINGFFEQVDERSTVNELFDTAVNDLVATHGVPMPARATHWEKYYAIEAAVPEVSEEMHTLTVAWCTNYRGKRLNNRQRHAVIEAFRSIQAHVTSVKGSARGEAATAS
jgi:hypothetical protein